MANSVTAPLIALSACVREIDIHPFHVVGEKYLTAVRDGADGFPLMLPSLAENTDTAEILAHVDGLMFTGSRSNVEPHHYGGPACTRETMLDTQRDSFTLPLIRDAVAAGMPLLAICRGCQELNVALGGTLHQTVHEVQGRIDHREDKSQSRDVQYGPAHDVLLTPGGLLASIWPRPLAEVNSLHAQGIDRIAPNLCVEATAPDGQIEAVSGDSCAGFCLGIQWHPEWKVLENDFSMAIFTAFGNAARAYAKERSVS